MQIKKGDKVQVIAGKNKKETGKVLAVFPKKNRVVVEGINMVKKHTKPSQDNQQGGIVEFEAPIDASNVMILDPKTNQPTKVGHKFIDDKKVRYAKKSGELLDK
jgi:large subunit ribosomal protein L24